MSTANEPLGHLSKLWHIRMQCGKQDVQGGGKSPLGWQRIKGMLTSTAGQEELQTQAAMSNYHCIQLLPPAILTLTMLSFLNSCVFFF